jgi:hypothetical protein
MMITKKISTNEGARADASEMASEAAAVPFGALAVSIDAAAPGSFCLG